MKVRQVAEYCQVSRQTVYAWIKNDALPVEYAGSRIRVRKSTLDRWMAEISAQVEARLNSARPPV